MSHALPTVVEVPEVPEVIVVGGGMGGLSAAIALAGAGKRVRLYERGALGGKVGTVVVDGIEVDTGASVLTLPSVVANVLARAGLRLDEHLELVRPAPAFRYHFGDGRDLDVFVSLDNTLASVRDVLGADAADDLGAFLASAARIWRASSDRFVFAAAPTLAQMAALALRQPRALIDVDPLRNMASAIAAQVRSPELRLLLLRYATYNGSDPWRAPATLNCISHVELALGGFGVKGGMAALTRVLVDAASGLGVDVQTGHVDGVVVESGVVVGVDVNGAVVRCGAVVVNADVGWLRTATPAAAKALLSSSSLAPSMSGATAVLRARRRAERPAHAVVFSANYREEARDIFERLRPPKAPTVYLCAQEKAHLREGWADDEPLFAMVNTPPIGVHNDGALDDDCLERGLDLARGRGLLDANDEVVWRRSARELAALFPGSAGSLYGAASNDRRAAFLRPKNAVTGIRGLYLASGSAHPGGGVPLCLQSGLLAADALLAAGQSAERGVKRRVV